jgi:hypothetical protein
MVIALCCRSNAASGSASPRSGGKAVAHGVSHGRIVRDTPEPRKGQKKSGPHDLNGAYVRRALVGFGILFFRPLGLAKNQCPGVVPGLDLRAAKPVMRNPG